MKAISRRRLLQRTGLTLTGAVAGAVGVAVTFDMPVSADLRHRRLPSEGGYAPLTDPRRAAPPSSLGLHWSVPTDQKLVALTFDDGPQPQWTPRVLDILDQYEVPATFFVVGKNVTQHGRLLDDRIGRHEIGNHTWSHDDLALASYAEAYDSLRRTHDAVTDLTGKGPTLFRPPWGHVGGAALTVGANLGYAAVIWSVQMPERRYPGDPGGLAKHVIAAAAPGSIMLAHDVGNPRRLITIDALPTIIGGLRGRGFEFVTVTELMAAARTDHSPSPSGSA